MLTYLIYEYDAHNPADFSTIEVCTYLNIGKHIPQQFVTMQRTTRIKYSSVPIQLYLLTVYCSIIAVTHSII